MDMTDTKRNSLSQVSVEQVKLLSQPVFVTVYYSSEISAENPVVGKYAEFVLQFLNQYRNVNPEKFFIAVKNPIPYSEEEKEAKKAGLEAFQTAKGGNNLYFGAVLKDGDGKTLTIPYFSWERDFWLEKDLTNIITQFNQPKKKVVGLISPVHKIIKREFAKGITGYAIAQELMERYNIMELSPSSKEIPSSVDILLLVLPRKIAPMLQYAIDQYVMAGGKVIVLADILSEQADYRMTKETLSDLNKLLTSWGVEASETMVGSRYYGKKIYIRSGQKETRQTSYPLWLNLTKEAINQNEPITKGLSDIRLQTALEFMEKEHTDDISVTPLLKIEDGAIFHKEEMEMGKNYIISSYEADKKMHILSVFIQGKFQSIFAGQPEFATDNKLPFLYYSAKPTEIMLIGDSDLITDNVWLENGELSDNGQFILRAVDIMLGQSEFAPLYKSQSKIYQESLGAQLYNQVTLRHRETISRLQTELQDLKTDYDILSKNVENGVQRMNASTAKQMNEIQDKVKEIENRLQYYNYTIKKAFETQKQYIILINMLIIPLVEILLLILAYNGYIRRSRRKIKEKFNAR